ncbi:MAG: hypothetical protein NXI09_04020 [Bacteroidetes bacterium]|nr:hypothetical protein [Bacteroidota bacterium]
MSRKALLVGGQWAICISSQAQVYTPYGQIQGSSGYPGSNGGNIGIGTRNQGLQLPLNLYRFIWLALTKREINSLI